MIDSPDASHGVNGAETAMHAPVKIRRGFWQWVWTILVMLLGAFFGFIVAYIVGLATGLIDVVC